MSCLWRLIPFVAKKSLHASILLPPSLPLLWTTFWSNRFLKSSLTSLPKLLRKKSHLETQYHPYQTSRTAMQAFELSHTPLRCRSHGHCKASRYQGMTLMIVSQCKSSIKSLRIALGDVFDRRFLGQNLPYVPILETSLRADDCYEHSPLLFWTILAIGSMRFYQDPTLIISVGPKVLDLAKDAVFSCKDVVATIQSFTLLCAWPMPMDTLEKDPSPALAGAALQLAISIGLHVWGIGQDFARKRLSPGGRNSRDFRARLWVNCLIVCQRQVFTCYLPVPALKFQTLMRWQSQYCLRRSTTTGARYVSIRKIWRNFVVRSNA